MKKFTVLLLSLIMALSLTACGGDGDVVTPEGMKPAGRAAGNEAVAYSFFYPAEWELIRDTATIELKYDCNPAESVAEYATVSVLGFELSDENINQTAKEYWLDGHKSEVESVMSDFVSHNGDGEESKLGDTVAWRVKYSGNINNHPYYSDQLICCRYGSVYLVTLVFPEELSGSDDSVKASLTEDFESIIADFEFDDSLF